MKRKRNVDLRSLRNKGSNFTKEGNEYSRIGNYWSLAWKRFSEDCLQLWCWASKVISYLITVQVAKCYEGSLKHWPWWVDQWCKVIWNNKIRLTSKHPVELMQLLNIVLLRSLGRSSWLHVASQMDTERLVSNIIRNCVVHQQVSSNLNWLQPFRKYLQIHTCIRTKYILTEFNKILTMHVIYCKSFLTEKWSSYFPISI